MVEQNSKPPPPQLSDVRRCSHAVAAGQVCGAEQAGIELLPWAVFTPQKLLFDQSVLETFVLINWKLFSGK